VALLSQKFSEKRCFLPNINTKIFATCPPDYTWNPDNVFSMLRHRNLTKGGYAAGGGGGGGYGSIETSYSNFSSSSSSSSHSHKESWGGGGRRQEAVQMWPQEVNLKLRISKLLLFEKKIKIVHFIFRLLT